MQHNSPPSFSAGLYLGKERLSQREIFLSYKKFLNI